MTRNYLVFSVIVYLGIATYDSTIKNISGEILWASLSILFMILLALTEIKNAIKALDKTENAKP